MTSARRDQGGLTLIELVVAVAVFALFSVMAYGALERALSERDRIAAEQSFWSALSLAFLRLEDDLTQARPRGVRDIDGQLLPAFRGQPTDTRALGAPSLEFTRGGVLVLDKSARSDMQRIAYRLQDDVLQRISWPVLDRAPQTTPLESTLLRNVESFTVRFYGPNGDWLDQWPAEGVPQVLPSGVEITLKITGRGEFTRYFIVNG